MEDDQINEEATAMRLYEGINLGVKFYKANLQKELNNFNQTIGNLINKLINKKEEFIYSVAKLEQKYDEISSKIPKGGSSFMAAIEMNNYFSSVNMEYNKFQEKRLKLLGEIEDLVRNSVFLEEAEKNCVNLNSTPNKRREDVTNNTPKEVTNNTPKEENHSHMGKEECKSERESKINLHLNINEEVINRLTLPEDKAEEMSENSNSGKSEFLRKKRNSSRNGEDEAERDKHRSNNNFNNNFNNNYHSHSNYQNNQNYQSNNQNQKFTKKKHFHSTNPLKNKFGESEKQINLFFNSDKFSDNLNISEDKEIIEKLKQMFPAYSLRYEHIVKFLKKKLIKSFEFNALTANTLEKQVKEYIESTQKNSPNNYNSDIYLLLHIHTNKPENCTANSTLFIRVKEMFSKRCATFKGNELIIGGRLNKNIQDSSNQSNNNQSHNQNLLNFFKEISNDTFMNFYTINSIKISVYNLLEDVLNEIENFNMNSMVHNIEKKEFKSLKEQQEILRNLREGYMKIVGVEDQY